MITKILRWFGFVAIDYGCSCGYHYVMIGGKTIAQTSGDDFWLEDERVRALAIALIPNCEWKEPTK